MTRERKKNSPHQREETAGRTKGEMFNLELVEPEKKKGKGRRLLDGEEALFSVVLDLLADEVSGGCRDSVLEACCLDCRAVDGESVVVKELLIDVRGERGGSDALCLAHVGPGAEVLVVSSLRSVLKVELCGRGEHDAIEASLDAKDALEE